MPEPLTPDLALLVDLGEQAIRASPTGYCRSEAVELVSSRRLLIVRGARGIGKTTLLQQYARRELQPSRRAYLSLDDVVFTKVGLLDAVHALPHSWPIIRIGQPTDEKTNPRARGRNCAPGSAPA